MKIWNSFGSEHSMNLRMIGRFREERDAARVEEMIERIARQLEADGLEFGAGDDQRFSDGMLELLKEVGMYSLGAHELEQLLYEGHVSRDGSTIHVHTQEADVSAYLKILVFMGGRVEVYSAHDYPDQDRAESREKAGDESS